MTKRSRKARGTALEPRRGGLLGFRHHLRAFAPAAAIITILVLLGIFRGGGLVPSARHVLVAVVLLFGAVWAAVEIVGTNRRDWKPHLRFEETPAFVFCVLAVFSAVSTQWSPTPTASLWAAALALGGIVYFCGGRRLASRTEHGLTAVSWGLAGLGTVIASVSLVAYAERIDGWVRELQGVTHALGPFGYANALAALLVLSIPATVGLAATWRQGRRKMVTGVVALGLGLQFWALWLTHSRGAQLCLAVVGAFCMVLLAARHVWARSQPTGQRLPLRGAAVAGIIAGSIGVWRLVMYLLARIADPLQNPDQARIQTWTAGVATARLKPILGWGADSWYVAYLPRRIGPPTRFAHNVLIQNWVELGVVGAGSILVLALWLAVLGFKLLWRVGWRDARLWLWIGAAAFLLQNIADLTWYIPALFYLWGFTLGAMSVHAHEPASLPSGRVG